MITVQNITKSYGRQEVLRGVSFSAQPGQVTGFLGRNGAGKCTTLRVLVGLVRADAGTADVLGSAYADLHEPARQVGVMLDAGAFHGGRTGQETLATGAFQLGIGRSRVTECLEMVGLTGSAARKRVRCYSLGMRQRLGLAHALLADPQVLILDEPANGLDPDGIRWLRGLLAERARLGRTVLLSSHLLSEVEKVADTVVVTDGGRGIALSTAPGRGLLAHVDPELVGRLCRDAGLALTLLHRTQACTLEDIVLARGESQTQEDPRGALAIT